MYLSEVNKPNGVFFREYRFLCNVYIKARIEYCQAAEQNQYFRHSIDVLKAKWYQFHEIDSDEDNDEEFEEIDMFLESGVTEHTVNSNIGIISMGDDHNYYLTKLITDIYGIEESEKDNNNHKMPAHQKVITCSYLEIIKTKESTIYYTENKKKAMICTLLRSRNLRNT